MPNPSFVRRIAMSKRLAKMIDEDPIEAARLLLVNPFWISELKTEQLYERFHDDHDGTFKGSLGVSCLPNGDIQVGVMGVPTGFALRFRNVFGGGMSERVRNALMLLALAIKLDNEEHPQYKPEEGECPEEE